MKETRIVTASKCADEREFRKSALLGGVKDLLPGPIQFRLFLNNTAGLCKVYNEAIDQCADEGFTGIVVFVHDDVRIEDLFFFEKLNAAIEVFDIVGLAGTGELNLESPVLWHNSPQEKWSGAVAHRYPDAASEPGIEPIHVNGFGPMPKKCVVLDGLFIAVNFDAILEKGVRFDEQFDFHFYDLDFCLTAHSRGLSCGTWPIWTVHNSHGDFRNEAWQLNESKFKKKWAKQQDQGRS